MRFIIARHAQTEANLRNVMYGATDSQLTKKGIEQTMQLAGILKHERIDWIYTSPMQRTLALAQAVSDETGTKLQIRDELRELNFGMFEDKTCEQIEREHPREWGEWTLDYKGYQIPGGDSFSSWRRLTADFADSIKEMDGTALIVTHGGNVRSLITHLLGLETDQMWHFKIEPASRTYIEYSGGYGVLSAIVPLCQGIGI